MFALLFTFSIMHPNNYSEICCNLRNKGIDTHSKRIIPQKYRKHLPCRVMAQKLLILSYVGILF
jgi:hypothetical protein